MRSMFLIPLSFVSFINHVITTMFPDCKFLFKELESSGLPWVCVGSSCLLRAFQSAFLDSAEVFVYLIVISLSKWWISAPAAEIESWSPAHIQHHDFLLKMPLKLAKVSKFVMSCLFKQGPCYKSWYFLKHKSTLKNKIKSEKGHVYFRAFFFTFMSMTGLINVIPKKHCLIYRAVFSSINSLVLIIYMLITYLKFRVCFCFFFYVLNLL